MMASTQDNEWWRAAKFNVVRLHIDKIRAVTYTAVQKMSELEALVQDGNGLKTSSPKRYQGAFNTIMSQIFHQLKELRRSFELVYQAMQKKSHCWEQLPGLRQMADDYNKTQWGPLAYLFPIPPHFSIQPPAPPMPWSYSLPPKPAAAPVPMPAARKRTRPAAATADAINKIISQPLIPHPSAAARALNLPSERAHPGTKANREPLVNPRFDTASTAAAPASGPPSLPSVVIKDEEKDQCDIGFDARRIADALLDDLASLYSPNKKVKLEDSEDSESKQSAFDQDGCNMGSIHPSRKGNLASGSSLGTLSPLQASTRSFDGQHARRLVQYSSSEVADIQ